ncbi:MAG: hypothetical protein JSR63_11875 [Proteobacteria bacterium]|nr:hypothetical protein [Pseudomonadota bacterium]
MKMPLRLTAIALAALALAGCNGSKPTAAGVVTSDDPDTPRQPLPRPQADGRAVTGMPDARAQPAAVDPGTVATTPALPPDATALPPSLDEDTATSPATSASTTPTAPPDSGTRGTTAAGDNAEPPAKDNETKQP